MISVFGTWFGFIGCSLCHIVYLCHCFFKTIRPQKLFQRLWVWYLNFWIQLSDILNECTEGLLIDIRLSSPKHQWITIWPYRTISHLFGQVISANNIPVQIPYINLLSKEFQYTVFSIEMYWNSNQSILRPKRMR